MSPKSSRIRWNNLPPSSTSQNPNSPTPPYPAVESSTTSLLNQIGRDLTKLAHEGRLKPLFGRQKELRQLQRILLRKQQNDPLLVGAPGVGKNGSGGRTG